MTVSGGNNAVIRNGCTDAAEQFIRFISRKQIFKPLAVKLRACVFKKILLEESIRSVGFGSEFITPQVMGHIQCALNTCRVFGIENGFELYLFAIAHSGDTLCKGVERVDISHAVKHIRCDLRNYRVKAIVHTVADISLIEYRGVTVEGVCFHWETQPHSLFFGIANGVFRRTRYKQTNGKVRYLRFFVRQGHSVIYLRSVIMHGGDIQPALKHAVIIFLLHSADLFCVQKRNGTFGDTFEVGKQFIFEGKPTELGKIAHIMSDGNGVQAVGAVDEVFDTDGVFGIVCIVEYLLGHGVKHGQFLIGKRGKPLGKEVQLVQAESVQADVLQFRQNIAFEDADFNRVFSADSTSSLHSVLDFIVRRRQQ